MNFKKTIFLLGLMGAFYPLYSSAQSVPGSCNANKGKIFPILAVNLSKGGDEFFSVTVEKGLEIGSWHHLGEREGKLMYTLLMEGYITHKKFRIMECSHDKVTSITVGGYE